MAINSGKFVNELSDLMSSYAAVNGLAEASSNLVAVMGAYGAIERDYIQCNEG